MEVLISLPIFQQELKYQCKISASVMIDSHCPKHKKLIPISRRHYTDHLDFT